MSARVALAFALVLGAAACQLENQLVVCGELLCPAGTTCIGDRCATADELAACDDLLDGEVCAVDNAVGRCRTGVCEAIGCGNGRVDDGEACDDGNTQYADGCSGDCQSAETCGNGVVDFLLGESCDCATDQTGKPARCRLPNGDDLEAECSTTCQLRFCGDEVVNTLEQCDGPLVRDATCQDFGYYGGELACSALCRYEIATCTGRCGDGLVDPVYGEYCDGVAPSETCVGLGYDAGSVGCSSGCSPALDACERFGWARLDTAIARSIWGDARDLLVVRQTGQAYMLINGIEEPAPAGNYLVATGTTSGTAYAIGATTIARWSGTQWSTIAPGWPTTATPTAAWASTTLGIYVVAGGTLWRYAGGSWTDEGGSNFIGVAGDPTTSTVFAWTTTAIQRSTGGTWLAEILPDLAGATIAGFAAGAGARWLGLSNNKLLLLTNLALPPVNVGVITSLAAGSSGEVVASPSLLRAFPDGRPAESLGSPGGIPQRAVFDRDGGVVLASNGGTFRLRTGAWFAQQFITDNNMLSDARSFHVTPWDTKLIASGDVCWFADTGSQYFSYLANLPWGLSDCAQSVDREVVFVDALGVWYVPVGEVDGTLALAGGYNVIRIQRSGALVVSGGGNEVAITSSSAAGPWTSHTLVNYEARIADALSDGTLVVLARNISTGNHAIITVDSDGTTTELPGSTRTTAWNDLWIAPDDTIFAVGGSTLWSQVVGNAEVMTEFAGTSLTSVGGTRTDDVFVSGTVSTFGIFSGLAHWDGLAWTQVRLADARAPRWLHVTSSRLSYAAGRNYYSLDRVVRW